MAKKKFIVGEVEKYYIEGNCLAKSQEEIARIFNVDPSEIEDAYKKAKAKRSNHFQTYKGTVAMTEAQSSIETKKPTYVDEKNIHRL